jgi:hypothetical protein
MVEAVKVDAGVDRTVECRGHAHRQQPPPNDEGPPGRGEHCEVPVAMLGIQYSNPQRTHLQSWSSAIACHHRKP